MDLKSLCPKCKRYIVYGTICATCLLSLGHASDLEHTEQQRAPQRVYQAHATVVSTSTAASTSISQLPLADGKTLIWRPPGSS
jgi:predicted amidophosphoribosyltransferase